ncbi:threonine synthase-like 1 [Pelobates cultripes]|uniref:Threonine synthase-like 1 n=1 Tax=Pelobates cultripes TaxID=61616 RepID=A0AAD1RZR5_PELCU|nr:threonine synthase-like 1 [Pelobates cultripes]
MPLFSLHSTTGLLRPFMSKPLARIKLQKLWKSTYNILLKGKNLILMGPPGSGKTSVGKILGHKLDCPVVDVDDDVLEKKWNMSVSEKLQDVGDEQFLEEEGRVLLNFSTSGSVISLTGSNPLHTSSMEHARKNAIVVYLDVQTQDIIDRLECMKVDRIVGQRSGASIGDILQKRKNIYKKWHDVRVLCQAGDDIETVADKVIDAVNRYQKQDSEAFLSTRSSSSDQKARECKTKYFSDAVVEGLASDGGLYIPEEGMPKIAAGDWERLIRATYAERAQVILERCIHPADVPAIILGEIIEKAYGENFDCNKIAPVRHLVGNQFILELFHGPTASFKDLALQFMPQIFAYCIPKTCNYVILVATSGDTGSAVLDGFGSLSDIDKQRIGVFCLYPENGISPLQKYQILVSQGQNRQALGVQSDFDFCQTAIKEIFNNADFTGFLTAEYGTILSTANSINWGRLLPQVVYHASSYLDLVSQGVISFGSPVDVCIPTGNFGNALAAVYAKQMGIPIRKIICASNQNHILTDFIKTGHYDLRGRKLQLSYSPSIDILKSSNLERYLHLISNGDGQLVKEFYGQLQNQGHCQLPDHVFQLLQQDLISDWCSEKDCLAAIHSVHSATGYILDPHTAVAKVVADRVQDRTCPVIISSTAHYSKFAPVILQALKIEDLKRSPLSQLHILDSFHPLPPSHKQLLNTLKMKENTESKVCEADSDTVMGHMESFVQNTFLKVF